MPFGYKRRRRGSPSTKELAHGEQLLKRFTLPKSGSTRWSWVGTEVITPENISLDNQLTAYGFSIKSGAPSCPNSYLASKAATSGVDESGDVIIVSDDESAPVCSKKNCKGNPRCLNYMGQEVWENGTKVKSIFKKLTHSGDDPNLLSREPDLPVGLRNLGATCYANSSLQVWFRDIAFRNGVYQCQIPEGGQDRLKDSPIFQLQVTFAALQESKESVFNPSNLVESLQLRTSEQQDAQEFSKLFMSHLDAEFKKQSDPKVKMLIESQFQGSQVYGTFCHACQYKSEHTTDFLEVEINFDGPSRLEERISASLEHETLSGDNKYFCPECNCLQDATRYTELRQLPPVLHFSLLRFVYDLQTMERKKQKHVIAFPTTLDMNQFLGKKDDSSPNTNAALPTEDNLYELRGILLHKGSSAYHGHYEAQAYDTELTSWFQFNDETVTSIEAIVDKPRVAKDAAATTAKEKRGKGRPKKKRRIEDSGDEEIESQAQLAKDELQAEKDEPLISSKDAYMLVYARRGHGKDCIPLDPPVAALEVINGLNDAHEKSCEEYEERNDSIKEAFKERLGLVQSIYREWQTSELAKDSVVVSEYGLRNWLSDCWYADIISQSNEASSEAQIQSMSNTKILCEHNKLDPSKANDMKVISQSTYEEILHQTACDFDPVLTISDICTECVAANFKERLYEVDHPRLVQECEEVQEIQDGHDVGFWISKPWFRDWKGSKPKMHVFSEEDPPPDATNFYSDVLCEHGGVTPSSTHRKKISQEAKELLNSLFPSWQPPSADSDICAVCEAQASMSKEDKREMRRKAEEEKSKLKHMNSMTYAFFSGTSPSCAIVPTRFYKAWKRWVDSPTSQPRPETVDNTPFLCEPHTMLLYDPNSSGEIDSIITIIRRDEWDHLTSFYSAGPIIALQKTPENQYGTEIPICSDCRMKRQKHWETTEIIVQLSGRETTTKPVVTNGYSATRQSKRIRKMQGDRRRITVSKDTSVKDIKILISDLFEIPTICQILTLHGVELQDNEATAESLDILANDIVELRQMTEEIDIDAVSDAGSGPSKSREEGRGFNGTVLGGGMTTDSSKPSSRSASLDPMVVEKACRTCTFSNDAEAVSCAMCDTIFE